MFNHLKLIKRAGKHHEDLTSNFEYFHRFFASH